MAQNQSEEARMAQATPASDYVSIVSLVVAIASFIASLVSAAIAKGAREDAESIAERAHDEWANVVATNAFRFLHRRRDLTSALSTIHSFSVGPILVAH